jgi:hypothetical protein
MLARRGGRLWRAHHKAARTARDEQIALCLRFKRCPRSSYHLLACRRTQVAPLPLTDARHCSSELYMQWSAPPCALEHHWRLAAFPGVTEAIMANVAAMILAAKINFCI